MTATIAGRQIEGLLFDADGTLIDTHDIILTSMRYTVNEVLGKDLNEAQLMKYVGTPLYDQMLVFADGDKAKAEELVTIYRAHNDAIHDQGIKTFPHAVQALTALEDAGFKMGVVTSKRHAMAELGLKLSGIDRFFTILVGSDDWSEHKPEPGPILRGCELIGIAPSACMYIGDSPYDIQAGRRADCLTAAALWGVFDAQELIDEHPTITCDSLSDLANRLT